VDIGSFKDKCALRNLFKTLLVRAVRPLWRENCYPVMRISKRRMERVFETSSLKRCRMGLKGRELVHQVGETGGINVGGLRFSGGGGQLPGAGSPVERRRGPGAHLRSCATQRDAERSQGFQFVPRLPRFPDKPLGIPSRESCSRPAISSRPKNSSRPAPDVPFRAATMQARSKATSCAGSGLVCRRISSDQSRARNNAE
jgi:hypothetical protein